MVREFKTTRDKIEVSPLPAVAMLQAINIMCCSNLNFYFSDFTFTVQNLQDLEDEIVKHVRGWLSLNNSKTRSLMFCRRSEGGSGLLNPSAVYSARHLSFKLSALNSDDSQVRETARSSLTIHIQKRKAQKATPGNENTFAGYKRAKEGNL